MNIALPQSADAGKYLTGVDKHGNFTSKSVELQEVETDAFFGGTTTSTSENTIGLTLQTYTLDDYDGKIVENTAVEFVAPDPDCCQWGVVVKVDTVNISPAAIDVIMMGCSRLTGTYGGANGVWKIRILNPAGPDAALLAYSSKSTALAAGDITFPIQAGKFMPDNGSVFIQALGVPSVRGWAKVKSYVGTSLIVTLPSNGVFGSGICGAWAIRLVDGAPDGIPVGQYNGLQVTYIGGVPNKIQVTFGSTRDGTNTRDLTLKSTIQKSYLSTFVAGTGNGGLIFSANLSGTHTITNTSAAVVGTGTAYLTDFKKGSTFTTAGGSSYTVLSVTDNTHLTLNGLATSTETGVTIKRGGPGVTGGLTIFNGDPVLEVFLVCSDTDGSTDIALASCNAAGTFDTLSGYTFSADIGALFYPLGNATGRSNANALIQNAGVPQVLLQSFAISASAVSVPFASLYPDYTTFSKLVFEFTGLLMGTNGVALDARLSKDGVTYDSGASNYAYGQTVADSASTATASNSTGNTLVRLNNSSVLSNNSALVHSLTIEMVDFNNSAAQPQFSWKFLHRVGTAAVQLTEGAATRLTAQVTQGLQVFASSGTISADRIRVIGIP